MELSSKCPIGRHHMHGKVGRKIHHVKVAMSKELEKERLSVVQWETVRVVQDELGIIRELGEIVTFADMKTKTDHARSAGTQ